MSWQQLLAKDHPAWRLAEQGVKLVALALVLAYFGADELGPKDFAAALGAAIGGRLLGGRT